MRTRVKICGITSREDAALAISAGADALGFNAWRGSKRYLDLREAAAWMADLPPFVTRVALLVNAPVEEALALASLQGLDLLQLHGDEDVAYCEDLRSRGVPFIKALRVGNAADLADARLYSTPHLLLDAQVAGHFGGTGVQVDLEVAAGFREQSPDLTVTLAGGLRPQNIAAAIRQVWPYAVDVCSGVESAPGKKEPRLLAELMASVHGADAVRDR